MNDPEKEKILTLSQWYKNIFPLPAPKDDEFIALVSSAIANIYIPVDEDFGMTPVESMSCWIPVIGVREGGLLETIIEGKTGKLIDIPNEDKWVIHLKQVIENTWIEEWNTMKDDCQKRANDFSLVNFTENLKKYLW